MVVSLMVIYLLIAVTYLLYLPKYNLLIPSASYTRVRTHFVVSPAQGMEHRASGMLVLLHQVYKSTVDNKREALNMISKAILLISFILGCISLINHLQLSNRRDLKVRYAYQYIYLCYCSLRI
jgi:hypothetical protein